MRAQCRCQQLMALVPSLRILKVFSQPWEGDVTMVLPSTYMQIKKSITNPTAEDLRTACRQARGPPGWCGVACWALYVTAGASPLSGAARKCHVYLRRQFPDSVLSVLLCGRGLALHGGAELQLVSQRGRKER